MRANDEALGGEGRMLVLTRKIGESVVLSRSISVTVADIRNERVRVVLRIPEIVRVRKVAPNESTLATIDTEQDLNLSAGRAELKINTVSITLTVDEAVVFDSWGFLKLVDVRGGRARLGFRTPRSLTPQRTALIQPQIPGETSFP